MQLKSALFVAVILARRLRNDGSTIAMGPLAPFDNQNWLKHFVAMTEVPQSMGSLEFNFRILTYVKGGN